MMDSYTLVKQGYAIQQTIYKYDLAADVAFALRLKAPQAWTGRPTKPAYVGFDGPDNLWQEVDVLPSPRFASQTFQPPYGGTFVDRAKLFSNNGESVKVKAVYEITSGKGGER
jgi:hypothetical protein